MRARGDFGDDAAERAVRFILPDHRLRQDLAVARHQRRGAVVARRFKGKDQRHRRSPLPEAGGFALARRRDDDWIDPWHARFAAGAGAGADDRDARSKRRMAGRAARCGSSPCAPAATASRTARWPRSAARRCGPRNSTSRCSAGETDCSVHSMKDVESDRPAALRIAAMLPRADVRDRLIGAGSLADLPPGAVVGTSSPRRAAQVRRHPARPRHRLDPRQCRNPAGQARRGRGRCDPARRRRARPARARRSRQRRSRSTSCCRPRRRARSGSSAAPTMPASTALLGAIDHADTQRRGRRRARLHARARRHLPFAGRGAGAGRGRGRSHFRCELFSEDGADHIADDRAVRGRRPRCPGRTGAGAARPRAARRSAACSTRRDEAAADPAPRAGRGRHRRARPRARPRTRDLPVVRDRAGGMDAARPGALRRPAADQRQRASPRRARGLAR